jgi:leucyl-tRNA synthetase
LPRAQRAAPDGLGRVRHARRERRDGLGGHPKDWTYGNIADMRAQMKPLGLPSTGRAMFATCDPEYYGQQQALFLDFLEKGLVYRKNATVNWDPVDMTVLANEQVIDGKGWRSGAEVERRELTQWFFKISDFSEELLEALDGLENWPAKVKLMQANWIGKSRGLQFAFGCTTAPTATTGSRSTPPGPTRCWAHPSSAFRPTTRWPRSWRAGKRESPPSRRMRARAAPPRRPRKGREAGLRHRAHGAHPLRPAWELPVWIANFILMDYGTGAIFGCPAHDQRDLDFAGNTGCRWSIPSSRWMNVKPGRHRGLRAAQDRKGALDSTIFAWALPWRPGQEAIDASHRDFARRKGVGQGVTKFRLRDWGLSRQRYWGCPIPVVHCDACGVVPEKKENLPVRCPTT